MLSFWKYHFESIILHMDEKKILENKNTKM